MSDWKTYKLGEIAEIIARGISPKYAKTGVPVINQKCVRDGKIKFNDIKFNDATLKKVSEDKHLRKNDILVNSTGQGTLGRVGQINFEINEFTYDSHVTLVRIDKAFDQIFVGYKLKSLQSYIESMAEGSTGQTELNREKLRQLEITIPDLATQTAIAQILTSLDDKIELNLQMNQTLEAMAQALFKEWFVNFNFPDHDSLDEKEGLNHDSLDLLDEKEGLNHDSLDLLDEKEGLNHDSLDEQEGLNHDSLDLLDEKDSEKKKSKEKNQANQDNPQNQGSDNLPKGWRMGKLGEEFNLTMGQSPKGETLNQENEGMIFYQGRTDFGFRFPSNRIYTTEPNRIANKLDTLVCVRAPVGDINMAIEKCCIGRGLSAVMHKSNAYSYTYYLMNNIEPIFKGFESEGTVFGSLNKNNFENIEVVVPNKQLLKDFEKVINPIDEKILNNSLQIQTLTQTRDALLPKLMSGRLNLDFLDGQDSKDFKKSNQGNQENHKNQGSDK